MVKKIKDKNSLTSAVEKLSFLDFKESVGWECFGPARLPEFVSDLFLYMVGINLREYSYVKGLRDQEEKD